MPYVNKYTTTYCDVYGNTCQVIILENDYVGPVTELNASPKPFTITYESTSDFKFDTIRASSAIVNFILDDSQNLDELLEADERKYKLEHYVGANLQWVGYVLPNGYSYNFTGGFYEASVEASDGLTSLESISFLDDNTGEPYGTQDLIFNDGFLFPFILIATEILRKLDLDLNLWTCVDVYEQSMQTLGDREADPLANAFVNVKSYIDDSDRTDRPYWREPGEVFNCLEVMENLLNIFSAKLYQSAGTWRIKRVNVDAEYGSGITQRYWRKYNALSGYIGKEIVNREESIPCNSIAKAFIENDHTLSADEAYKAFRVNYDYTFIRDGDSPVSLVENVGFNDWVYDNKLASPEGWTRIRYQRNTFPLSGFFPKINKITIPTNEEPNTIDGFDVAMEFGSQPTGFDDNSILASSSLFQSRIRYNNSIFLKKGSEIRIELWAKFKIVHRINSSFPFYQVVLPTFQIGLLSTLENLGEGNFFRSFQDCEYLLYGDFPNTTERGTDQATWLKIIDDDTRRRFIALSGDSTDDPQVYKWRKIEVFVPQTPIDGFLVFDMLGLTANRGTGDDVNEFPLNTSTGEEGYEQVGYGFGFSPPPLLITGLRLGFIPEESNYAEITDYVYENPKPNYTLQVDPIEVLNGDTLSDVHVSSIIVPTNTSGRKNFWDTISGDYGKSSIGLIQAKSIMNLYFCPLRVLEGTIKLPNASFDTRYLFEALPNRKFVLQRGTFYQKEGYVEDATFVEISNEFLPPGGTEGADNLDPRWVFTGVTRCEKNGSNTNTGNLEGQQIDTNPNSETYNDIRWIIIEFNSPQCPLGQPQKYYWGTQPEVFDINLFNAEFIPTTNVSSINVRYFNTGGNYIYLIHLASLGVIEQVSGVLQPQIISDFQYFTDITLDGFLYRVFRQNYVTTQFDNLLLTFKFTT